MSNVQGLRQVLRPIVWPGVNWQFSSLMMPSPFSALT